MSVKVNYDPITGMVLGYYPDEIAYSNIPQPIILITKEEHSANLGKTMKVVDEVFVEHTIPDEIILANLKSQKIHQMVLIRKALQIENITHNGITIIATEKARDNLFKAWSIATALSSPALSWLDVNNVEVPITMKNAAKILSILMEKDSFLYHREATIIWAINACTSADDILDGNGGVITQGVNSILIDFS